ncbi:glycoside hydrolase family 3 C-terminal domain-containing protein [Haloactinomyces albus]|uniref:Exo-alpha-(1->6)-L-arabinopyranosidase n=1 Tax=Haloactinomyces albus TaxID=1352928 RepID=A0AAE3ZDH0_9ACTN|nr:glycoside hydrolase family 3 C-terminal domain-containing protein [Haloactinomyces albus]MDR7302871.1 beta-glucosidase [Haloactinomyces albus]
MKARPLRLFAAIGLSVACTVSAASTAGQATAAEANTPIYLDPSYSARERAVDLVSRMTLQEKASQMISSQSPAIPRLGVKAHGWWNEAAHGVAREQYNDGDNPKVLTNTTSYPVSLSMGSTWNPDLMYRVASRTSSEAREVVRNNTLDLSFYSPTINLSRDPRWGRNDETFSEDPTLTAKMGSQFVNGMEGKDKNGNLLPSAEGYLKTSTTIKHFAANNSEYNRRTGSSNMDERTLREYYTAPFREVIRNSDPGSIMAAYNRVNGVPASADLHLLDTLARKTFGFDGFFTSDCDSVYEIQHGHQWQPPNKEEPVDHIERNAYANAAGIDLNCNQGFHDEHHYGNTLPTAVEKGIKTHNGVYTENFMDASLVRMFTVRIKLGEFDDPADVPWVRKARERVPRGSWENSNANNAVTQTPKRLELAREAAAESIVLLRNEPVDGSGSKLLPLKVPESGPFRVAVIGNHAKKMYLGGYSSNQGSAGLANSTTGYEGIKTAIKAINPDAVVDYLPGTAPGTEHQLNTETVAKSANYDTAIVYAGTGEETASESNDRENLTLPKPQTTLINEVAGKNPNTVVYMETVGTVDVRSFSSDVSALLWSSYNGQRKGEALADVLLGQANPSGHLPFTWYRSESQLPSIGDYSIRPTDSQPGRTYMYFDGDVSYPFGYGLSYTDFEYGDLRIDRSSVTPNGTVHVSAKVTNTGERAGSDVIQLYGAAPKSEKAQRPDKRLVAFEKISLKPGETERVEFDVRARELALFDQQQGHFEVTNGDYTLQLARSSSTSGVAQRASFQVHGELKLRPVTASTTPRAKGDAARGITVRKIFPRNTVVQPRITVSMNDGTLHGHVAEGSGKPFPPGMNVRYRSNRPNVVSVDHQGTIRTSDEGVATVTATVKYRGSTTSTSFVIKVR